MPTFKNAQAQQFYHEEYARLIAQAEKLGLSRFSHAEAEHVCLAAENKARLRATQLDDRLTAQAKAAQRQAFIQSVLH